jgi:hypothetical protein
MSPSNDTAPRARLRLLGGALALALLLPAATVRPEPSFECSGDGSSARCVLAVAEGLALEAAAGATDFFDGEGRMSGAVVLRTPFREFQLLDADLEFIMRDEDPRIELFGSAGVPIGDFELLGARAGAHPRAALGIIGRENLRALLETPEKPLPLAEIPGVEPTYLFFHFATGLELDLGLAERLGLNTEEGAHDPFQYNFPGDISLTLIFDPLDPYFFISSDARQLAARSLDDLRRRVERARELWEEERRRQEEEANQDGDDEDGGKKKKKKARKKKRRGGIQLGSFAFSEGAGIPFVPRTTWGLPDHLAGFTGQLHADTTIPLGYGVKISGPVVTRVDLDEPSWQLAGNGDVAVGFEFPGGVVGLSFPLGEASAGFRVGADLALVYFSGVLSPKTSFLPREVPISPSATVRMAAFIDSDHLEDTRFLAEGNFVLGLKELGALSGAKTSKALVIEGTLSIDRNGFFIRGSTSSSLHKDLVFAGKTTVEAFISALDPASSYVLMSGELSVGGVDLGAGAEAKLNADGLVISGHFTTPISEIEMRGEITRSGPLLSGAAAVNFALGGISDAFEKARADVEAARHKVEQLDIEIERQRAIVRAERDRDLAPLRDAEADVAAKQREVDRIQSLINANNSRISRLRAEIADWNRWYRGLPGWRKVIEAARYAAEVARREAEIVALQAANTGLQASLAVARAALEVARRALAALAAAINVIPVDLDPRVAALIVARELAVAVLRVAEAALGAFPELHGDFSGRVLLTLGRRGMHGDVRATLEGVELIDGWVDLDGSPSACVRVAPFGNVCAPF